MKLIDDITAYQNNDLARCASHLRRAERMWHEDWVAQGSKDEGLCTSGKGLQVPNE